MELNGPMEGQTSKLSAIHEDLESLQRKQHIQTSEIWIK
jgi:hypothetical protein